MTEIDSISLVKNDRLEEELKKYFGYNSFRQHQKEIIQALLRKEDVLAILPTGAGKSICYQLPALLENGTAIVISPLISLMQDQVISLYKNGIAAAYINSSLPIHEIRYVLDNLSKYKLIYVAPERLVDPQFSNRLKEIPISFFVIDEAHCISQWGHSFRIEYRKLSLLKKTFPHCPIIALTATATLDVQKDIQIQLAMQNPTLIKGSFDRPNLTIRLHPKTHLEKQLQAFLKDQEGRSGIIYASTRKGVETLYEQLKAKGILVAKYHAGLSEQERSVSQDAFIYDKLNLMVATVAFGMGIHKPDIRFVVHVDMPKNIEQYYQEIGRAGRDGLPADCLMFYGSQDFVLYTKFLEDIEDKEIKKLMKGKTNKMYSFCTSENCRRVELLRYFGENFTKYPCHSCDNCLNNSIFEDGTVIAQKILSCVFRLKQNVGIRMTCDVLRGSKNQNILSRGYDQLSTYGLLKDSSEQEVKHYITSLMGKNLLQQTEGEYPVLKWTEHSNAVVKGNEKVFFKKMTFDQKMSDKQKANKKDPQCDQDLYTELRLLRLSIANHEKVPPYVILSDRSLQEMATFFPQTLQELAKINGVGPLKIEKFGKEFLKKIRSFVKPAQATRGFDKNNSMNETVLLFKQGHSIEKIVGIRQLTRGTIIDHLATFIELGNPLDISSLVSLEKENLIREAIQKVGPIKLTPIKEILPEKITYDEIRLIAAFFRTVPQMTLGE